MKILKIKKEINEKIFSYYFVCSEWPKTSRKPKHWDVQK